MVKLKWYQKLLAARPKAIPEPSAETSTQSMWAKMMPRRFRTYSLNTEKQKQLRALSRVGIVRRGINVIKDGVLGLPYELTAVGKVSAKQLELQRSIVNNVLTNPNIVHDYRAFFGMVLEDLIVLDSGIFNKCKGGNPLRPLFLYPVDAVTISKLQPYNFTDPNGDMYEQQLNLVSPKTFSTNDIAWLQMNNFTDNPYGLSPIEVMYRYLSYFLDAIDNAADISSVDTIKFVLAFENAEQGKLKEAREYVESIQGTGNIPVFGGKVDSKQVGAINSDSLFIDWQKFLLTLCAKCLNLPESIFVVNDVNDRNNIAEVRQQIITDAIKPYADALERAINQHIIATMGITNVKFKFIYEESEDQKTTKSTRVMKEFTDGLHTENEARELLGRPKRASDYSDVTLIEAKAKINKDYNPNPGTSTGGLSGQGSVMDNGDAIKEAGKGGG